LFNPEILTDLIKVQMPYGRYKGTLLSDLPVSYLEWFQRQGFPAGRLGMMLATVYEIKLNGLEDILYQLKRGTR
jgi:uncharacterized protein (DUF3820 family)